MKLIKLPSSDPAVLALQVSLCEQVLSVLDIVEPGITSRRGDILRVTQNYFKTFYKKKLYIFKMKIFIVKCLPHTLDSRLGPDNLWRI